MPHVPTIFQFPMAIPFWVVFYLAFIREGKIIRPALGNQASTQDEGTFRALMIGSPLALLAAGAASFLPWLTIPYPVSALVAGTILLAAGAILRRFCFNALGASFTGKVVVYEGQKIVQNGVYRLVRHPSYTAAFIMFLGVGVALGNWSSIAILFFVHCYLYGRRVSVEEKALVRTLGEPYVKYMSQTKRFVPFVI